MIKRIKWFTIGFLATIMVISVLYNIQEWMSYEHIHSFAYFQLLKEIISIFRSGDRTDMIVCSWFFLVFGGLPIVSGLLLSKLKDND